MKYFWWTCLLGLAATNISGYVVDSVTDDKGEINLITHHDQNQLEGIMRVLAKEKFAEMYSVGKSGEGRDINALKFSGGLGSVSARPLLKPMVKYVANMHGNEVVGRELLIGLATHFATTYGKDNRTTRLLDAMEVHLVPTMNPDGYEATRRGNKDYTDLNRNFPEWTDLGKSRDELKSGRAAETKVMVDWVLDNPWVLSINFHDGAVVANYPWDDNNMRPSEKSDLFSDSGEGNRTPDDGLFIELAKLYAAKHTEMHTGSSSCDNGQFRDGITNGVEWYPIAGGMQDFNYLFTNCMEITVETSCVKKPSADKLQWEWKRNFESMMSYLEYTERSVRGLVKDTEGSPVPDAQVRVEGQGKIVTTSTRGEYWRLLLPGQYRFKAVGKGMESEWTKVEVVDGIGPRVDLQLIKEEITTTTEKPEEPAEPEGVKVSVLPGWCVEVKLFQLPQWC